MLFTANIAVEQDVMGVAITIALLILYVDALDGHQHSTFTQSLAETLLRHRLPK